MQHELLINIGLKFITFFLFVRIKKTHSRKLPVREDRKKWTDSLLNGMQDIENGCEVRFLAGPQNITYLS